MIYVYTKIKISTPEEGNHILIDCVYIGGEEITLRHL